MKRNKILKIGVIVALCILYIFGMLNTIAMTTHDLGRHIMNGKAVFEDSSILYTNYYSSNYPDFGFINHHWLSGVIFYLLFLLGGFSILTIFKMIVLLLAFIAVFLVSKKGSSFWISALVSVPVILIISERTQIRPEIFTYLFIAIFMFILYGVYRDNINSKWLWALPIITIIWVNLHVYFFVGLFLIFAFMMEDIVKKQERVFHSKRFKIVLMVFLLSCALTVINPNTFAGSLYPLTFSGNFGFATMENNSPFILNTMSSSPRISTYILMLFVFLASFIPTWRKQNISVIIISIFAVLSSIFIIRNIPLFAFLIMPIFAANIYHLKLSKRKFAIIAILLLSILASIFVIQPDTTPFGFGVEEDSLNASMFVKANNLSGGLFNNYDIGGYVIFHHFPTLRPFVDNRPEAYPNAFFREIYIPMQMFEDTWKSQMDEHNFSIIYFYYLESTDWGKGFLTRRFADPEWALVYVDSRTLIMVRKDHYPELSESEITKENVMEKIKHLSESDNLVTATHAAYIFELFERYDLSRQTYERVLSVDPRNIRSLLSIGDDERRGGENEDSLRSSIEYYELAVSYGANKPRLLISLANLYVMEENYDKAKGYLYWALLWNSFDSDVWNKLNIINALEITDKIR